MSLRFILLPLEPAYANSAFLRLPHLLHRAGPCWQLPETSHPAGMPHRATFLDPAILFRRRDRAFAPSLFQKMPSTLHSANPFRWSKCAQCGFSVVPETKANPA